MFAITCLLLTLLLAALSLWLLRRVGRALHTGDTMALLAAAAFAGFVYLYGAWIFLSAYARSAFAVTALLIAGGSIFFKIKFLDLPPRRNLRKALLAAVFIVLDVLYFTGISGNIHMVELQFPLKGGQYAVLQGGKGLPANLFHSLHNPLSCAMDIVKVDAYGMRCRKIFSRDLHDYYIFGDTVYAPCAGIVMRATSDRPDNIPPHRTGGRGNLNGVLIAGPDCMVFLGHMQQGKVFVAAGDTLRAGQPIGLAGNSGFSIEPHLHIQAHVRTGTAPWWARPQLFMLFGGKRYLLNDVVDGR